MIRRALLVLAVLAGVMVVVAPSASAAVVEPAAVDIEMDPAGSGYWVLDEAGTVHPFDGAPFHGSAGEGLAGDRAVALSATASGDGYWIFTASGRALRFGAAPELGDVSDLPLNAPVVESIVTPTSGGYWLVAGDGGVFALGDAPFYGSTGNLVLNQPVNSIVPGDDGYWLVAADGGVFSFGVPFRGSTGNLTLNAPVVGGIAFAGGYLLVAADGGIFNYSDGAFLGSLGNTGTDSPAVAVTAADDGDRYLILLADGQVYEFTRALADSGDLDGRRIATVALGGGGRIDQFVGTYVWDEPPAPGDPGSPQTRTHELFVVGPIDGTPEFSATLRTTGFQIDDVYDVRLRPVPGSIEVVYLAQRGGGTRYDSGEVLFRLYGPAAFPVTQLVGLDTLTGVPDNGRYFERTFDALERGERSDRVAGLQDLLNDFIALADVAMDVIREDGIFGPNTAAALGTFERYANLPDDEVATQTDLAVLENTVATLEADAADSVVGAGDEGAFVSSWQDKLDQWLRLTGVDADGIAVDAIFGPSTVEATRTFEDARGLQVDGVVEPEDRVSMRNALAALRAEDDVSLVFDGTVAVEVASACQPDATSTRVVTSAGSVVRVDVTGGSVTMDYESAEADLTTTNVTVEATSDQVTYTGRFSADIGPTTIALTIREDLAPC